MKNYAIILASGKGKRYSSDIPKQFVKIAGKTVFEHTIDIFQKSKDIDEIIIVITPEYRYFAEELLLKNKFSKVVKLLNGGETRKDSSCIRVSSIEDKEANVIIHDCARLFVTQRIIKDCVTALEKYNAVDVAIPTADTIIKVKDNIIESIPERKYLLRGQTPQCFKLSLIKKAHELAKNDNNFTDDCGLILKYCLDDVYVVEGNTENIKITYTSDIFMADRLFQVRSTLFPKEKDLSEVKDKIIAVFGGTSGIGESIVNMAKKYGAKVYPSSSRTGVDVTKYSDVKRFLKEIYDKEGKIDSVINSAGVLKIGKLLDRDIDDIKNDININYIGSINTSKASIPYLQETKGSILMFASSSYTRGRALYSTYSSTKAAIVNLVQALSEELISDGIRINVINPERTATPMRYRALGNEPEESLLEADKVAEASIKTILSNLTGQVVDVKKGE
ncbi:2-C-methyl-D-erythritol 4-phosphate cytidylyltransferase [bacterium]|nr:2-C-methyl-D-erythritol 4-phosphate cytidylyltransferase [bacterium]